MFPPQIPPLCSIFCAPLRIHAQSLAGVFVPARMEKETHMPSCRFYGTQDDVDVVALLGGKYSEP